MGIDIKRKPVAFNIKDPDQRKLYEHCMQRTNFSYYIKTLILRDMEGPKNIDVETLQRVPGESNETLDISSFI